LRLHGLLLQHHHLLLQLLRALPHLLFDGADLLLDLGIGRQRHLAQVE
jgi:hypothetical protein